MSIPPADVPSCPFEHTCGGCGHLNRGEAAWAGRVGQQISLFGCGSCGQRFWIITHWTHDHESGELAHRYAPNPN